MELHTHTVHSDGTLEPIDLINGSVERQYEAIVSSDHNTISAVPHLQRLGKERGLVVIGGIEWTTFWGHFVVSGGNSNVDWREVNKENIDQKISEAKESGDTVTLAHPQRIGGRICCGCHNYYDIKNWDNIDALEIWSRHYPNINLANVAAKELWVSLLDKGHKIAAVYGYDWHNKDESCPPYACTYLGIDGEINANSFNEALKKRRTYVSEGVILDVTVKLGGTFYEIGSDLPEGEAEIFVKANVDDFFAKTYKTEIKAVSLVGTACDNKVSGDTMNVKTNLKRGHFRVEVSGRVENTDGELAITSAYFVG
jgi:hypothetical protein